MSLIHKALKKAENGEQKPLSPAPNEEFIGAKPPSQFTPRSIILLVLIALSLVFLIYKKIHNRQATVKAIAAASISSPAVQQQASSQAALSGAATEAAQAPGTLQTADPMVILLMDEGKKLFAAGQFDAALTKFNEAALSSPQNAEVLNNIGLTYKKKNNLTEAEKAYKQALAIKPDYPECLNNLGVIKASGGDILEASVYLKKAAKLKPTYPDPYFNLAVLNEGEGNLREAVQNYKLFLQYTDTDDTALISRIKERVEELSE